MTDTDYYTKMDEAIKEAANVMDLADLDSDDEDLAQDMYEARFHCGTCVVRTVMETVWPPIGEYIDVLTDERDRLRAVETAVREWLADPTDLTFTTLNATLDQQDAHK